MIYIPQRNLNLTIEKVTKPSFFKVTRGDNSLNKIIKGR